jgi:hypothetical protein
MTLDPLLIAMGCYPGVTSINKFGRNSDCAASGDEHIWDGSVDYSFPTDTTEMTHIRAAVDSATTQGAVIELQGLDANWELVTQTKALDGTNSTTEVALDTALIRCFRMKVLDGSTLDQDVWLGDDDFVVAAAKAIILAGYNQTQMAIYTVPANHYAFVTNYYAHHNPTTGQTFTSNLIELWGADAGNGYARQIKHGVGVPEDAGFVHPFDPYVKFGPKTDIFITSSPVGAAADISAGFDIILVDAAVYSGLYQ